MKNALRLTSFFLPFCPFTSNLFVNVKLYRYRSLSNFFSKNAALKTIVIPLSTVFTRISTAALIQSPKCGAYWSNYGNLQLHRLLHLGQNVITFRTLLHLGSYITFRPSTTVRRHFTSFSLLFSCAN